MSVSAALGLVLSFVAMFLLSGFFSGSETAMMAINRYRLRHSARKGNKRAKQILQLLKRPDRLLGVVLIGNVFCNVLVSSIMTLVVVHHYGEPAVFPATVVLTILILIFAESAPKTMAALHPMVFARVASPVLKFLLKLFYPLVWSVTVVANGFLRLFRVKIDHVKEEGLTSEELSTLVKEASGQLSTQYRDMLLSILSLEQIDVNDILIPRNEIVGIDLERPWEVIKAQIEKVHFGYLPVYRGHINQVIGILRVQDLVKDAVEGTLTLESVESHLLEVYFIPERAQLSQQLVYFQQENKQVGLVVDEYGDILGLVTMQDILEEIVGQFAGNMAPAARKVEKQDDGSYIIDAGVGTRDLNRILGWKLPVDGPNTLSGLIIDYLESIPSEPQTLMLEGHRIEIKSIDGVTIDKVRVWAAPEDEPSDDEEAGE